MFTLRWTLVHRCSFDTHFQRTTSSWSRSWGRQTYFGRPFIFGLTMYRQTVAQKPRCKQIMQTIMLVMTASRVPSGVSNPPLLRITYLVIRCPTLRVSSNETPSSSASVDRLRVIAVRIQSSCDGSPIFSPEVYLVALLQTQPVSVHLYFTFSSVSSTATESCPVAFTGDRIQPAAPGFMAPVRAPVWRTNPGRWQIRPVPATHPNQRSVAREARL